MPFKDREAQREYQRLHHQQRRGPKYQRWEETRTFIDSLKEPCVVCGENDPIVLCLHHLNPKEKESTPHRMVMGNWSRERILAEVAKCVWVCANDHTRIHAGSVIL